MAPYDLSGLSSTIATALVFGTIGFGFGFTLELGGFGDTRKLAAQFYLKDMTVLKVMFTAIVVAAVLVAGATGFGLLDMSRVWVNPTYLWPGIVGGLIMGVGFVLGGFCPGTTLVAAATLKVDGMLFLLGALIGVWLFGETVGRYENFFISSNMGRFTLPEWLGLPVGVTVLLVVLMALLLFWGGELAEQVFGRGRAWAEVSLRPSRPLLMAGSALLLASVVVMAKGQPTPAQKFDLLGPEARRPVDERAVFVHPAEVVALKNDISVQVNILDLRDEHDFNLFHLGGSRRADPVALLQATQLKELLALPGSSVTFLVGAGEAQASPPGRSSRPRGSATSTSSRVASITGSSSTRPLPALPSGSPRTTLVRPAGASHTPPATTCHLPGQSSRAPAPSARPASWPSRPPRGTRAATGGRPGRPTSSPGR